MDLDFLRDEQEWLAKQVVISTNDRMFDASDVLFGVDIQYVKEEAFCAIAAYQFNGTHLDTFIFKTQTGMEYVSGFFCFREGPPVLRTIRKILATKNLIPQLIIIDGHGIAHPRKLGIASWIGVKTNIPSIGVAKRPLLKYDGELGLERGSTLPIFRKGQEVGSVLRTQTDIKPVYVSPGYKMSLTQSNQIILDCSPTYRISEPIRLADQVARVFAKGKKMPNVTIL
ncbi:MULTISPECIES: endonuclease V [unclassified Aureispira]|uniref:endonuclease V n=1 Tax=unclassified Aureispira TaxID=2649989 RepID=UPI0006966BBF|nr:MULTISPECIES: endonuclease V [unclassified Aureispira]WMX12849.1 endonuclease V [Aureispira sp. CCB-E]